MILVGAPKTRMPVGIKKIKTVIIGVSSENEDSIKTWTRGHVLYLGKDLNTLCSFPKTSSKG